MRSKFQPAGFLLPRVAARRPGVGRWQEFMAPLVGLAEEHAPLRGRDLAEYTRGDETFALPRFIFRGPAGGGDLIRLGIFAGIHGDEPAGPLAVRELLEHLVREPELATGYELVFYPLCNPSGFEDGTREARGGPDLNREFWRGSVEPEVYLLERELGVLEFQGLIALHSDDTSDGVYAFVRGATLTEALAQPALAAAGAHLPIADSGVIDGFAATSGLIHGDCYEGVLSNPRELAPAPFEIIFETPGRARLEDQVAATVAALRSLLVEYRTLSAYAQNL